MAFFAEGLPETEEKMDRVALSVLAGAVVVLVAAGVGVLVLGATCPELVASCAVYGAGVVCGLAVVVVAGALYLHRLLRSRQECLAPISQTPPEEVAAQAESVLLTQTEVHIVSTECEIGQGPSRPELSALPETRLPTPFDTWCAQWRPTWSWATASPVTDDIAPTATRWNGGYAQEWEKVITFVAEMRARLSSSKEGFRPVTREEWKRQFGLCRQFCEIASQEYRTQWEEVRAVLEGRAQIPPNMAPSWRVYLEGLQEGREKACAFDSIKRCLASLDSEPRRWQELEVVVEGVLSSAFPHTNRSQ